MGDGHRNVESCLRGKGNEQEGKGVSDVLALSYQDLSCHLKPCFLSLGHFPEDYELNTSWYFGPNVGRWRNYTRHTLKRDGRRNIGGCCRSIFGWANWEVYGSSGSKEFKWKSCLLHDLMRDLCLLKAREETFLEITNLLQEETISSSGNSNHSKESPKTSHKFGSRCSCGVSSRGYISF